MKIVSPNASEIVREVVKDFTDFVGKTYGPAGKKILIHNTFSVKGVDDGKMVAEEYELRDESHNAVVLYIKEALSKTDQRVGDGTTTAAIITGAIVQNVLSSNELLSKNPASEVPELQKAVVEAVKAIKDSSKPVKTEKELYGVALNSCNDEELAKLISKTIYEIGKDGVVSVEDSQTVKTECEVVQGTEVKKGYASPYLINDKDDKVSLKNAYVILANKKIDSIKELVPLLKGLSQGVNKDICLIAEGYGDEVINFLVLNKIQGFLRPLLIENPFFGEHRLDFLQDIATVCGGEIVDDKTGVALESLTPDKLGRAQSIVAKKDSTLITGGKGLKSEVNKRVDELKTQLEKSTNPFEKDKLYKRIASLNGGVAVIKVGADTENEQKTKKLKVEDAVNATKIAFQHGVVAGAGRTFEKIKTSSQTLNDALKAPRKKLEENGKEFLDEKVIDPTEVLVAALESAVSIACGLISMGGIIATKREKKRDDIDY